MNRADIKRIIEQQGYAPYFHERVSTRGDGTSCCNVQIHRGQRRPIYIGAMTKLAAMSEADLVMLIKTKTAKSAQGAAQKDEVAQ